MKSYQSPSSASLKGGVAAPCSGKREEREREREGGGRTKDVILCRCFEEGVVDVQGAGGGDTLQMWGRGDRTQRWQMSEQARGGKDGVLEEISDA